jgi:endoglucanase
MRNLAMFGVAMWLPIAGCNPYAKAQPSQIRPQNAPQSQPPETPQVRQIYAIAEDTIALEISAEQVLRGQQQSYQAQFGDRLQNPRPVGDDWLERGFGAVGSLIGPQRNLFIPFDRVVGQPLQLPQADRPQPYRLRSATDANYRIAQMPTAVHRKSKPTDMARTGPWEFGWAMSHTLYLRFAKPLQAGQTYQIQLGHSALPAQTWTYQPDRDRSEAVQVSQLGFRPGDPAKVAFLSTWMGNGGGVHYGDRPFSLVNQTTGQVILRGRTQLSRAATELEDSKGRNYNGTHVYWMDFSQVKTPGDYRVCVDRVGCSFAFPIQEQVWERAFFTSIRGLYHQRSGIELKPPYTPLKRPRTFHPADGVKVYPSSVRLMDVTEGIGQIETFAALQKTKLTTPLPDAWGGYFDAGDWDRRAFHLEIPRLLLEMLELSPQKWERFSLNLPESNNALPDVLDEALWTVDFFRRLQTSEGGVRGGIQSAIDPKWGEASWQESGQVYAYAPDSWSSYLYAGAAARAAFHLKSRNPVLARTYQDSALQAMNFAEREIKTLASVPFQVRDERNFAALELYRLTGDRTWHQLFLQTTILRDPTQELDVWAQQQQSDAAFLYVRLPDSQTDPEIRRHALNALLRQADGISALSDRTGFKWTKLHPDAPVGWGNGLGTPKGVSLVRAHVLTKQPKYLRSALLATQFSAGANPLNLVYTTGLGQRSPRNPLVVDQRVIHQPPPPGITLYGPMDLQVNADNWTLKLMQDRLFPAPAQYATAEAYFDVFLFPAVAEYTVMQSIAPTAYLWGYLAAQPPPKVLSSRN